MFQNKNVHQLLVVVFLLVGILVGMVVVNFLFSVQVLVQLVMDGLKFVNAPVHAIRMRVKTLFVCRG